METVLSSFITTWQVSGQKLRMPALMCSSIGLSKLVCGLVHQGHSPGQPCPSLDGEMPASPECWVHGHQGRLVSHQLLPMAVNLFVFPLRAPELAGSRHFVGMGLAFPCARPLRSCLPQRPLLLRTFKALFRALKRLSWTFEVEKISLN